MIQRDYEKEALEARAEAEAYERAEQLQREHELKLAELELKRPRIDGRTKIWLNICKAPTFPFVVVVIYLLSSRGKPVPKVLENFLR